MFDFEWVGKTFRNIMSAQDNAMADERGEYFKPTSPGPVMRFWLDAMVLDKSDQVVEKISTRMALHAMKFDPDRSDENKTEITWFCPFSDDDNKVNLDLDGLTHADEIEKEVTSLLYSIWAQLREGNNQGVFFKKDDNGAWCLLNDSIGNEWNLKDNKPINEDKNILRLNISVDLPDGPTQESFIKKRLDNYRKRDNAALMGHL